jgi:signal transduction histidine kinase
MLPTSHFEPINACQAEDRGDSVNLHAEAGSQASTHNAADTQARGAVLLASEFSEFIAAASQLEKSYRALQEEVSVLGLELSERNAELNTSLAENKAMRLALQQIVDSMPCGVLVLDHSAEVTMINPETRQLLGLEQTLFSEGSKVTLRQLSAWSGVNLQASYEDTCSSDTGQEFCVRDSSGNRWLEVRKRGLFHQKTNAGLPDQTILILRDITAQKRSEQEREAGRKAMALAEITAILAHEIRNPLGSLELFAELIENDDTRRDEWISNLRAGIRSLSGMVNNVLSFHSSGSLALAPVPLSTLIGNAIKFVQPLADQAAVSLDWLADRENAMILGSESALQQVVLNLVSNAIRHTSAGGNVTVSIQPVTGLASSAEACDEIVAEFSDTGCGIRADQIDHIFEPGFSGSGDSSGLGLAVCNRIMKQHGGSISVSNRAGSGAQFTLHFPVYQLELATA